MKNKEDKNIEKLVDKMMKETPLETPSFDFTSTIMSAVWASDKKNSFSYKPVISKRGWFIILSAIGGLISWLIFNGYTQNNTATNFDFSFINPGRMLNLLSGFQFSGTTATIMLIAMTMIFIQIILLKGYLNKRFHK